MAHIRNFFLGILVLAILLVVGTTGYHHFENLPWSFAFYNAFLTASTNGAPIEPVTYEGKAVALFLVFFGLGIMLYLVTFVAQSVIEGQTRELLGELKGGMTRMKSMKDHYIVAGYGRLGKYVCSTLKEEKAKYIIIESNRDLVTELIRKGEKALYGDVLDPHTLEKANVKHAKGLIATLSQDADNIYLTMGAKEMNPKLVLAAKATAEQAVARLHNVGAAIVVLPQVVGGKQLAKAVLNAKKD